MTLQAQQRRGAIPHKLYGTARTATRSFHAHHLRLISLAINVATAELISAGASVLAGRLFSPDAA